MKTIYLTAVLATATTLQTSLALKSYLNNIPNGALFTQELGHPGSDESKFTAFATAFQGADLTWTADFCKAKFPGASITNGEAFGDPCCTWKKGGTPDAKVTAFTTTPGDPAVCKTAASPAPAAATPAPAASPAATKAPVASPAATKAPATTSAAPTATSAAPAATKAPATTPAPSGVDDDDDDDDDETPTPATTTTPTSSAPSAKPSPGKGDATIPPTPGKGCTIKDKGKGGKGGNGSGGKGSGGKGSGGYPGKGGNSTAGGSGKGKGSGWGGWGGKGGKGGKNSTTTTSAPKTVLPRDDEEQY